MEIENPEHLGKDLSYEDYIPVAWRCVEDPIEDAKLEHLNHSNEEVLYSVTTLEKLHFESTIDDDSENYSSELSQLDFKLNMIMDLVSELLQGQRKLPETVSVNISCDSIQWICKQALPEVNQMIILEVYLHHRLPKPLLIYGRVAEHESVQQDNTRVLMKFELSSSPIRDLLEKMIFRQHRRKVAQSKRHDTW